MIRSFVLLMPFLMLCAYFLIEDPMKIIYNTDDPTSSGVLMNDRLQQARHLENNPKKYNSYILGSSRSKAFKTKNWNSHLNSPSTYHLGVNDETLFGLERKLNFLDSTGADIHNVLILLDHRLISLVKNHKAHIFREYHGLTNETAPAFYQRFFTAFLDLNFISRYWDYKQTGNVSGSDNYLWDPGFKFDEKTGDIFYARMDQAITSDSAKFYSDNLSEFHDRESKVSDKLINEEALTLLRRIQNLLKKNKTSFKIIITPNYDQIVMHPSDVNYLTHLFGKTNVFNYSGVNEITKEIGNYYEYKHFKPYIANQLMNRVYTHDSY